MAEQLLIDVRASALPGYFDCPRQSAAKMLRGEVEAEGYQLNRLGHSAAASIGTLLHEIMAEMFKQKMAYGIIDYEDAYNARFEKLEAALAGEVIWDKTTPHVEVAKEQLEAMCTAFLPIVHATNPLDVETYREAVVSPLGNTAIPVKVFGTRDLMDSLHQIHDHKTGSNFPQCHAQVGLYALLAQLNGEPVTGVRVNWAKRMPLAKVHEAEVRSVEFPLDECIQAAWATIREYQRSYENWIATKDPWSFPANPYSMRCTEKYCPAWGTDWCRVGKGAENG